MRTADTLAVLRNISQRGALSRKCAPTILTTNDSCIWPGLGEKCECIEVVEPADFYQDGMDACADGTYERDCPHADGSARVQWLRGYRDFMPIRGEWEAENHDRARMYA